MSMRLEGSSLKGQPKTRLQNNIARYIQLKAQVDGVKRIKERNKEMLDVSIKKFQIPVYSSLFGLRKDAVERNLSSLLDQESKLLKKADDLERVKALFDTGLCRTDSMHPAHGSISK